MKRTLVERVAVAQSEREFRELLRRARWSPWYRLTKIGLWLTSRHDRKEKGE